MTAKELLRIEGTPIYDTEYGMPDVQTVNDISRATYQTLSNEIPGFQVGPRIGQSMLGTLVVLRTIEAITTDALQKGDSDNNTDIFRFSSQQPRPIYRELRRMGPRIALEYRERYQTPPHADRFERGLAVHHQFGSVRRRVSLAHLLDDTASLEAQVNEHNHLASDGANYKGEGISDPAIADYIDDIHRGETMHGVLTIFAEGHLCINALKGQLLRSVHYFENADARAGLTDWTRYSGRKSDNELSADELRFRSARFSAAFMHLHAAQLYKDIVAGGVAPIDVIDISSSDRATISDDAHRITGDDNLALTLLRYANHPGHGDRIHYEEDSQVAFLSTPGDLDALYGQP